MTPVNEASNELLLSEIESVGGQLSPENLFCDGEISHEEGVAKYHKLLAYQSMISKELTSRGVKHTTYQ